MRPSPILCGFAVLIPAILLVGQAPAPQDHSATVPSPASLPAHPATEPAFRPTRFTETNLPPRLNITLDPNVMWTTLPPQVQGASAGPDGRVWLALKYPGGILTQAGAEAIIRREFSQKMPQLSLFDPILFEPGGRIWFLVRASDSGRDDQAAGLIGYDGKTFIEHLPAPQTRFQCDWAGTGRVGAATALFVDGKAFFVSSNAIHIYDGHNWTIHEIPNTRASYAQRALSLYPEPDGKGVVVVSLGTAQPVWRWRDGNWTRHATGIIDNTRARDQPMMPSRFPAVRPELSATPSAAPRRHGVWILTTHDGPIYVPFDPAEANALQPITVADLIQQLAAPETRDNAAQELLARGPLAEPDLRQAIAAANDADSRTQLEKILAALPNRSVVRDAWKMGSYSVSSLDFITALPNGATLFQARRVLNSSGKPAVAPPANAHDNDPANLYPLAPAVLIQEPGGDVHPLEDVPLLRQFGLISANAWDRSVTPSLLAVKDGSRLWTLASNFQNGPELLDLATGRALQHIPLPGATSVAAVAADGTLFVTIDQIMAQTPETQVLALRPTGKDTRRLVDPMERATAARSGALTVDGCYWFLQHPADSKTDFVPARYNGKTVETYPDARIHTEEPVENIIAGRDGILVQTRKSCILATPRGSCRGDDLENLIAQNAPEFARTFTGALPIPSGYEPRQIVADPAGNIWLLRPGTAQLKVFTQGAWLDAAESLRKAGNPRGSVIVIVPVGQTGKILASDRFQNAPGQTVWPKITFLLSVAHNQIVAEPQPDMLGLRPHNSLPNYSPAGEPWLEIVRPKSAQGFERAVCRMTPNGPAEILDNTSLLLTDSAGNVWLTPETASGASGAMRVYRDQKLTPAPALPFPLESMQFWTAPGGLLYHPSLLGLQSIRLKERTGAWTVEDVETFAFGGIKARPNVLGISPLGFAVVQISPPGSPTPGSNLFFYPLDRP